MGDGREKKDKGGKERDRKGRQEGRDPEGQRARKEGRTSLKTRSFISLCAHHPLPPQYWALHLVGQLLVISGI